MFAWTPELLRVSAAVTARAQGPVFGAATKSSVVMNEAVMTELGACLVEDVRRRRLKFSEAGASSFTVSGRGSSHAELCKFSQSVEAVLTPPV